MNRILVPSRIIYSPAAARPRGVGNNLVNLLSTASFEARHQSFGQAVPRSDDRGGVLTWARRWSVCETERRRSLGVLVDRSRDHRVPARPAGSRHLRQATPVAAGAWYDSGAAQRCRRAGQSVPDRDGCCHVHWTVSVRQLGLLAVGRPVRNVTRYQSRGVGGRDLVAGVEVRTSHLHRGPSPPRYHH